MSERTSNMPVTVPPNFTTNTIINDFKDQNGLNNSS